MKKITQKEVDKLTHYFYRATRKSPLLEECSKLKWGEILFVGIKEWQGFGYAKKVSPSTIIGSAVCQTREGHRSIIEGMRFTTKKYQEGWVIKRIE